MEKDFSGRVWVLGDDVDTDIIIPTEYLALPNVQAMAPYAFSPLRPRLAAQIAPGDILVAGRNFGCGSSREQAPEVLKALGLAAVVAKSYARIFYRNALNNGLLLLESGEAPDAVREGDEIQVFPGEKLVHRGREYPLAAMDPALARILANGGLVQTARLQKGRKREENEAAAQKARRAKDDFARGGGPGRRETLIEKIIRRNTGRAACAGETVAVRPDRLMIHDIFVPFVAEKFAQMGFDAVFDAGAVVLVYDHLVPAATADDVRHFKAGDAFAAAHGLTQVHRADGICHQLMVEKGYVGPGGVAFGTDSHTTTYGAVGAFSTGIGYTEMAAVLGTGELWVRVPKTIRVEIDGALPPHVGAKDIILRLLGDIGADGAVYAALEFGGGTVEAMTLASRMTMANMAVEAGAKCAVFAPREKAEEFSGPSGFDLRLLRPDAGAQYARVIRYRAEELAPVLACPSQVDRVRPAAELLGTKVDQVFLGSCTNGRYEDLAVAAAILRGKKVAPYLRLIVTPASRSVYGQAARDGTLDALLAAGATVTLPGCGLCCGRTGGILAGGEVVVATNNRNFMGRMGSADVQIYLASPAVAAATALAGEIALPE